MNFFKVRKFRKRHKSNLEKDSVVKTVVQPVEPNNENGFDCDLNNKSSPNSDDSAADFEDDDDDFITNEVKKRLKELRRNSFMALIPEEDESHVEDEEEGETMSSQWRDVEADVPQWWNGFSAAYEKYCERMIFFDKMSSQQLKEAGTLVPLSPSPRAASKKLPSPFRCLSLKRIEEPGEETERLQQPQSNPYQDLETAYVAQICLTWEALHCQYTQMSHLVSHQPAKLTCYNHSAQQFQQFHVLLDRFTENEAFEQGLRAEIYARARNVMAKLLQVPQIQGSDIKVTVEDDSDMMVLAPDLIKIIETSILTFQRFLKLDKKKPSVVLNMFGNHMGATPLQQVQSSLIKKGVKLKELSKKAKGWKKKSWPKTQDDVNLLFSLIDVKLIKRVLRMERINKEQLFWCEEKIKKLNLTEGKLQRDSSPTLFPCS